MMTPSNTNLDVEMGKQMSVYDLWAAITNGDAARSTFNTRVEYILSQFGSALHCNRFTIGECFEHAATDFMNEVGIHAHAVSSKKRIDILINNVSGLNALSSKFVSTGNHVILYNAQRTTATDMTLHPTILFRMNECWLLVPETIENMGISIKDFIKSTGDSVQLSFGLLKRLRESNYPYYLKHNIAYNKKMCANKSTSELLYRISKDLLDTDLDPIIRTYLETKMNSLQCRKT